MADFIKVFFAVSTLSILSLLIFLFLVFYIKSVFFHTIERKKYLIISFNYLIGIIFGVVLSLIFELIFKIKPYDSVGNNHVLLNAIFFMSCTFAIAFWYSKRTAIGYCFGCLIAWFIYLKTWNCDEMFDLLYILIMFAISITFVGTFKSNKLYYFAPLISAALMLILILSTKSYRVDWFQYAVWAIFIVFAYLCILIGKLISLLFDQLNAIRSKIYYENTYFVNPVYAKEYFIDFMSENKIKEGYITKIDLSKNSIENLEHVVKIIKENLVRFKHMFFKTDPYNFFVFIEATKDKRVDQTLTYIAKLLHTQNIEVDFLISIYGIHSCIFDELVQYAKLMTKPEVTNQAFVFEPQILYKVSSQVQKFYLLNKNLQLNRISIDFTKDTINEKQVCIPQISYPIDLNEDVLKKNYPAQINDIYRLISNNIIYSYIYSKYHGNYLLVLPYPIEYFDSSDFKPSEFVSSFVNNFGRQNIENVILTLDLEKINNLNRVNNNISELEKYGVKVYR